MKAIRRVVLPECARPALVAAVTKAIAAAARTEQRDDGKVCTLALESAARTSTEGWGERAV
jgi:nitrogen regulatory protein PII